MTELKSKFAASIRRFERPVMIIAASITLTAILMNLEFNLLEANLYDFRMAHGPQPQPDSRIALVTVDDSTTRALNEFSPLPLDLHARFLEALEKIHPKAIGYLVDLNRVARNYPEQTKGEAGNRFVKAAQRLQASGSVFMLGTPFDVTGEVLPPFPLSTLPHSIAVIHRDGNLFASDKVTRRALTFLYDRPVFHLELAQQLGWAPKDKAPRGSFYVPEVDGEYFFFRYHGNPAMMPRPAKAETQPSPYLRISFRDIIEQTPAAAALAGKVVLVGTMVRDDSTDFTFTPYAKSSYVNPKIAVHANILDSMAHNNGIVRAPAWINWAVTFVVIAVVLSWVLNSTPLYGVFATLSLAATFIIIGQILFLLQAIWIRESQPLVGIFLGYYLAVPYRLIREYKKRWDYQRKNELLIQVEELKTNFLSLVTHDLKTPVARIQGLTEVLMRHANERLVDRDRETLRHILASTEELNRFISSILELNKVESNRLRLSPESKDVNQLIERAVEGFKAQARASKITLRTNLEPLFPIRVDSSLIAKVINNLIDNALKYSPAGSEIEVTSQEIDNWVVISVVDQGIGMTDEERKNLFTRFYRAKNDTTTKIAGTGLGLYLTKYFVEAHQGRVEVTSQKGKGSTFKILLPITSQETAAAGTSGSVRASDDVESLWARMKNLFLNPVSDKEKHHV